VLRISVNRSRLSPGFFSLIHVTSASSALFTPSHLLSIFSLPFRGRSSRFLDSAEPPEAQHSNVKRSIGSGTVQSAVSDVEQVSRSSIAIDLASCNFRLIGPLLDSSSLYSFADSSANVNHAYGCYRIVLTVRSIPEPINGSLSCGDGVRSVDRGSTTACSFARSFARSHVSDRVNEQTHREEVDDTANSKELAPPCRNAASSIPVGSARSSFLLLLSLPIRDYCRRHRMRSSSTSLPLSPLLLRRMTSFANAGCCHRTRDRAEMRSPWLARESSRATSRWDFLSFRSVSSVVSSSSFDF